MITGKDLMEWGMEQGPIFRTALKVLGVSRKGFGKPQVEVAFKEMLKNPDLFTGHELLAPIAKELIKSREVAVEKKETTMNPNCCPYSIYGLGMIEQGALNQIYTAAKLPISVQAALMPDGHQGYGLPIGGVLATDNVVIPYAVGVDIGCRMKMTILNIPAKEAKGMIGWLENILKDNTVFGAGQDINTRVSHPVLDDDAFGIGRLKKIHLRDMAVRQLGTSGGGNHFVEFGTVELGDLKEPMLAILSHSGSRGVGYAVANIYTKIAMEMRKLPDTAKHLSWLSLDEEEGQEYWKAMDMCGNFAKACHDIIHSRIIRAMGAKKLADYENHHNFAWREKLNGRDVIVHRKGATPAGLGVPGIIPGSMTTPTYIVRGKGNEHSINSSSHGAGRAMTRTAAKQRYTMKDLRDDLALKGVTLIGGSVDECSMAYKDIDAVMASQTELVDIQGKFMPFLVRMAGEEKKPWQKGECE